MGDTKKPFFQKRTEAQIRAMDPKDVYRARGLVRRIADLDPSEDAIVARVQLIPAHYFWQNGTSNQAARRALKHGEERGWIKLQYPKTVEECERSTDIPLYIRERAFAPLEKMKEEEINIFGYYEKPTWDDRKSIVYPFIWSPQAVKLFAYAENFAGGIEAITKYQNALRVARTGATIPVSVPSESIGKDRYRFQWMNVPLAKSQHNLSNILRMRTSTIVNPLTGEPENGITEFMRFWIRYPKDESMQDSNVVWREPKGQAGYLGIVKEELKTNKNQIPMMMNPYSLFGVKAARFYDKMDNNVLIYDPTLQSKSNKQKLRHLNQAEKSLLWARAMGVFGFDEFGYWDFASGRDGALKEYWPRKQ